MNSNCELAFGTRRSLDIRGSMKSRPSATPMSGGIRGTLRAVEMVMPAKKLAYALEKGERRLEMRFSRQVSMSELMTSGAALDDYQGQSETPIEELLEKFDTKLFFGILFEDCLQSLHVSIKKSKIFCKKSILLCVAQGIRSRLRLNYWTQVVTAS